MSAEGKRQVRVSLKPQHQNPIPSPQKQVTQTEGWTDRWMDMDTRAHTQHTHTHTHTQKETSWVLWSGVQSLRAVLVNVGPVHRRAG